MKLTVTITKTAQGTHDYVQIMSEDMLSVNVVLVAESIEVQDRRPIKPQAPKPKGKARG